MARSNAGSKSRAAKAAPVPPRRTCGTMEVHHRLLEANPSFRLALGDLEHTTQDLMRRPMMLAAMGPVTIPVVVHVVYKTTVEKISASQVKSQIDALNRDYAAANKDKSTVPGVWSGLVGDAGIRFALAMKDPSGSATDGILYVQTTKDEFPQDDSVKHKSKGGSDAWPRDTYLNLWVCHLGGGLLGYAQFPGGPAKTDGVVILYSAFGNKGTAKKPYDLGRSATHEIGHWLNLRHIWGDTEDCTGNDYVADTPNAQHPNYGKPHFPHISCHNGPSGDMFVNYMDYVDDDTMVMFSAGQVARMHATLQTARSKIGK